MEIEVVNQLRQPEYTGENRCEPCTALNLSIAAVGSLALARRSHAGGAVAACISIGLIYLRGYLIPGTPTLTKQYMPPAVLRWFGKPPETPQTMGGLGASGDIPGRFTESRPTSQIRADEAESEATDDTGTDLEEYYLSKGVLNPCEDANDLCLTDEFESGWAEAISSLDEQDVSAEETIEAFGLDNDSAEPVLETHDEAWVLYAGEQPLGQWPSRAALLADLGSARLLSDLDDEWDDRSPQTKGEVLTGLRVFLEECPQDGGEIKFEERTVESCCQAHEVLAAVCSESGERVFEHPVDDLTV